MVSKTRDKLIEVARQLFARNGMENTTMIDIAEASEKGRRTIYTYFKNKREIYNAVIEKESDSLLMSLRNIVRSQLPPVDKLERYLRVRFEFLSELSPKRDYIRSLFLHDYKRVEKVRQMALAKEVDLFAQLINEGVAQGCFDADQAKRLKSIESFIFQGVDLAHARGRFNESGMNAAEIREQIITFLINAVKSHHQAASAQQIIDIQDETT